jgi:hypothetical protein
VHPVSSGDSPHPGWTLAALIYHDEPGEDGEPWYPPARWTHNPLITMPPAEPNDIG